MGFVLARLEQLVVDDDGQDLLEYGLLAVLIAVVVMTGVTAVGQTIMWVFWRAIGNAV